MSLFGSKFENSPLCSSGNIPVVQLADIYVITHSLTLLTDRSSFLPINIKPKYEYSTAAIQTQIISIDANYQSVRIRKFVAYHSMATPVVTDKWAGNFDCTVCRRKRLVGSEFSKKVRNNQKDVLYQNVPVPPLKIENDGGCF
jgi:hypothetical protein